MAVDPPYMYSSANSKHGFHSQDLGPKAGAHMSWTSSTTEFNKHPDSWEPFRPTHTSVRPLGPKTKSKVKCGRFIQLALRLCGLVGAFGLLFCVICIRGTDQTTAWIIRASPSITIVHNLYATYHLSQPAHVRAPTSSASYMLFAAFIDACLLPFYGFTAMAADLETSQSNDDFGIWRIILAGDIAHGAIIRSTFIISIVIGALHLFSFCLSIYLGIMYRKIAILPPDMNPLEDNLTSRNRHKLIHDIDAQDWTPKSLVISSPVQESKHFEELLNASPRIPFMETRDNRMSHASLISADVPSRSSVSNMSELLPSRSEVPSLRTSRTFFPNLVCTEVETPQMQTARLQTVAAQLRRSPTKASSVYSRTTDGGLRPLSTTPSLPDTIDENWPEASFAPSSIARGLQSMANKGTGFKYKPVDQSVDHFSDETSQVRPKRSRNLTPLEMNPPTPPPQSEQNDLSPGRYGALTSVDTSTGYSKRDALSPATGNRSPQTLGVQNSRQTYAKGEKPQVGVETTRTRPAGRVISRSGIEIAMQEAGWGRIRKRDISGKMAEEGRA